MTTTQTTPTQATHPYRDTSQYPRTALKHEPKSHCPQALPTITDHKSPLYPNNVTPRSQATFFPLLPLRSDSRLLQTPPNQRLLHNNALQNPPHNLLYVPTTSVLIPCYSNKITPALLEQVKKLDFAIDKTGKMNDDCS